MLIYNFLALPFKNVFSFHQLAREEVSLLRDKKVDFTHIFFPNTRARCDVRETC